MNERNELILLYDYYGELLSESQQKYFEDYYFNNLSLGEVSEELNISRNAVHKQLKSAIEKLYFYEEKLKMINKNNLLIDKINEIKDDKIKQELIDIIES